MSGSQGANVHTVDALKDVRAALIKFLERTSTAMGELRQRIDRTIAWLELDRPNYWKDQERRTYDLIASTRVSYETCRLKTVGGRHSECIEEKKAFEKGKMRMEYVREKQRLVQKWMVQSGREANEYRARTGNFQRALDNDVPMMIAQLGRMIDAIEGYSEVTSELISSAASPVQTAEKPSPPATASADPNSTEVETVEQQDAPSRMNADE